MYRVVCPGIGIAIQWRNEVAKFASGLKCIVLKLASPEDLDISKLASFHIVVRFICRLNEL